MTRETSYVFYHACLGLTDLANYHLQSGFEFVLLSQFSTDPLEKGFGKLRQGCRGAYFINAQQICEKLQFLKQRLL